MIFYYTTIEKSMFLSGQDNGMGQDLREEDLGKEKKTRFSTYSFFLSVLKVPVVFDHPGYEHRVPSVCFDLSLWTSIPT